MRLTRRAWLAHQAGGVLGIPALATTTLAGCASPWADEPDRIVAVPSGGRLQPEDVLRRMQQADVVLLGELHDNPTHHVRRAALLEVLKPAKAITPEVAPRATPEARTTLVAVVAEHLPRGAAPRLKDSPEGDALRRALEAAGFDARSWGWPLHEPLFAAAARAGHRLIGGNLEREVARRVAREGLAAVPEESRRLLDAAPLQATARAALEHDLLRGHCGHLGPERMPGMVWAQRTRDAAMAATILAERDAARVAGPVLLLAGNGHVRRDYGVPQLLGSARAGLRLLSIGFLEHGSDEPPAVPYDIAWFTRAAEREDPCKAFAAPRPARPRPD